MPLRVNEGVGIPLERSASRELLSGFLESVAILPVELPPAPGETGGRLDVDTVRQQPRDEWCWAACAEMVLRFFSMPVDKCSVAGLELNRDCCASPEPCDVGLSVKGVDQAFDRAGLAGNRFESLTFEQVKAQLEGGPALGTAGLQLGRRPVVAGIAWQQKGGHLVVISGWRVDGHLRYLKVNDPFYTSGDIRYEDLVERYGPNNSGRWVHTWADLRRKG